jgi:hypothetical protein
MQFYCGKVQFPPIKTTREVSLLYSSVRQPNQIWSLAIYFNKQYGVEYTNNPHYPGVGASIRLVGVL